MKNKILCVINNFYNHEHIFLCFSSIYRDYIDYVILENYSKNSDKIENYFKDKRIIKHLRSEENITHGTVDYFFRTHKDLILNYDYLILTDGDLLVDDMDSYVNESKKILESSNVKICGIDLHKENLPLKTHPESIDWIHEGKRMENYIESSTGTHMLIIKNENFNIFFELKNIIDSFLYEKVKEKNGIWAKTIFNKAKHLTWDYYYPGNEYYEYKINNKWTQGIHSKRSNIKLIK